MPRQTGEYENQQDKTVLATIVREREFFETVNMGACVSELSVFPDAVGDIPVLVQRFVYDGQGIFDLGLDSFQEFCVDILCEEGVEFVLEGEADMAQAGAARGGRIVGGDPAIDSGAVGWRHYGGRKGAMKGWLMLYGVQE